MSGDTERSGPIGDTREAELVSLGVRNGDESGKRSPDNSPL